MMRAGCCIMLYEIYCEKFHQQRIVFNEGLSVVLGTNTGDNSIGKSTFLLIVDFVFGGSTYSHAEDILNNIGPHDIFFTFKFGEGEHKFCRNSVDSHNVWKCDNDYVKLSQIGVDEFCNWLDNQYQITLPALSLRDGVGRYIRVYGKENCLEHKPLHYTAVEKAEKACLALLKLFDAYAPIQTLAVQAEKSAQEYSSFTKAQKHHFIAKITKTQREKNQAEMKTLNDEIESLSSGLSQGLLDVDSVASDQALYVKSLLSRAKRIRSRLKSKLSVLENNGEYKFSGTTEGFSDLQRFFPDANIMKLAEVEEFHRRIASIFKAEIRSEKKAIEKEIEEYDKLIADYETQLKALIQDPSLSKTILLRHSELLKAIDRMRAENEAYDKLKMLKKNKQDDEARLQEVRQKKLAEVSYQLNEEMSRLNDAIYEGSYNAPLLDFTESQYTFYTPDDTGTGIAYKGLIVYDLAVLGLTKLPLLVHDSVILKQISDDAIEQIITLYANAGKQVIIALDKQTSYTENTEKILNECAVLRLAPGGEELFGKSWG